MQDDEQLQKDVQDALRRSSVIDVADVGITVERGVVALDGHVDDASQQVLAEGIVRRVPGVRAVVDDLDVRPPGAASVDDDLLLAREALDALDRRAGAPDERVQVIVDDGWVRLEGVVDSPAERDAAGTTVGDAVLGRGTVENLIVVRPDPTSGPIGSRTEDSPWDEDDFDNLRIDPDSGSRTETEIRSGRPSPGT